MCGAVACACTNACTRVDRRRREGQRYSPSALQQLQCCDGCMWEGKGGREDGCACVCPLVHVRTCVRERGATTAAPPCVVNPLSLYFRNWRTPPYSLFNFQPSAVVAIFLFFLHLFFSQLLCRLVSRGHLRAAALPADDATCSLAEFVFSNSDFFILK